MNYIQAIKKLEEDKLGKAVFIYGEEGYLIDSLIETIKGKYLSPANSILNYEKIDMEKADFTKVEESAETLNFMADKRIVELRGLDLSREGISKRKDFFASLEDYLPRISENTILLIVSSSGKFFNGKLKKKAQDHGHIIEIPRLKHKELENFVGKKLASNGIKIDRPTLNMLLDALAYENKDLGVSLYDVDNQLQKIIATAEGKVRREDVDRVINDSLVGNIFKLTDSICQFRPEQAISNFLILNQDGDNYQTFYMISRQFRNLLYIKLLQEEGQTKSGIKSITAIKDFELNKLLGFERNYSLNDLKRIMEEIYQTDVKLKSGKGDFAINMISLIASISEKKN